MYRKLPGLFLNTLLQENFLGTDYKYDGLATLSSYQSYVKIVELHIVRSCFDTLVSQITFKIPTHFMVNNIHDDDQWRV